MPRPLFLLPRSCIQELPSILWSYAILSRQAVLFTQLALSKPIFIQPLILLGTRKHHPKMADSSKVDIGENRELKEENEKRGESTRFHYILGWRLYTMALGLVSRALFGFHISDLTLGSDLRCSWLILKSPSSAPPLYRLQTISKSSTKVAGSSLDT